MDKFLIIDGNSLIFRAYYAMPFLSNSKGEPTGAVFGFLNMLFKVIDEYKPTHIAVAFDFAHKTFRNEIFEAYKGTRKETPNDLRLQFPILKKVLNALGIKYLEKQGIEADDIIGTLAKITTCETIILSGDRDVLQLIDDSTEVWLTKKGISEIYKVDSETLLQDFHLKPKQVIDLKALMGDSSDNISGVKGIGSKTATKLIEQFDTIEEIYNNLDNPNIEKGTRSKLENGKRDAEISKILATIKLDCDIETNFDNFVFKLPFNSEAIEIIYDLEMTSLLKRSTLFAQSDIEEEKYDNFEIIEISNIEDINKIINGKKFDKFAFFLQGNDLIFSFGEQKTYKIKDEFSLFYQPPEIKDCLNILKNYIEDENVKKIVSDVKKEMHNLSNYGIELKGEVFDLKIAEYLLNAKSLDEFAVGKYFYLKNEFENQLKKQGIYNLYTDIDRPLVDVLYAMETNGFKMDKIELERFSKYLDEKLKELSNKIFKIAGREFNLSSPKQLSEVLFNELNLPYNDNKKLSTSFENLINLIDIHPIISQILEFRKISTLKNKYVDSYKKIIAENGEIVHTIFNQTLTATGRLSSSEPNLQNIPVREDEGRELRKCFISRFSDGELVSADYNQIELRLLAHCSEDEKLLNGFKNNKDIHTITASEIFDINESEVSKNQRREAKAVNFGIIYGMSEYGLSQNIGISREHAGKYINKYFETYPDVKKYMDNNIVLAKKFGYAKTIFNRKRRIPEINAENYITRKFGERVAMNMPLQGSASDIIKLAMLKVFKEIKAKDLESKLILQIHDELIVDCPKNEVNEIKIILKNAMENVVQLKVPLPVEIDSGKNFFYL